MDSAVTVATERFENVGDGDTVAVSSSRDVSELGPRIGIAHGEELLVTLIIDDDWRHGRTWLEKHRVGITGIQDLDGDMVNSTAMSFEMRSDIWSSGRIDENDGDTTCCDHCDPRCVLRCGKSMEPEATGERIDGSVEVLDGHDDVVDACGHCVHRGVDGAQRVVRRCGLVRGSVAATSCDLDAMSFGEDDSHDFFDEIGIDGSIDRPLSTPGEDIAHSLRLNDRSVGLLLQSGNLVTDLESLGENLDQLTVELVDPIAQRRELR